MLLEAYALERAFASKLMVQNARSSCFGPLEASALEHSFSLQSPRHQLVVITSIWTDNLVDLDIGELSLGLDGNNMAYR